VPPAPHPPPPSRTRFPNVANRLRAVRAQFQYEEYRPAFSTRRGGASIWARNSVRFPTRPRGGGGMRAGGGRSYDDLPFTRRLTSTLVSTAAPSAAEAVVATGSLGRFTLYGAAPDSYPELFAIVSSLFRTTERGRTARKLAHRRRMRQRKSALLSLAPTGVTIRGQKPSHLSARDGSSSHS
jgi:hypothetical protein